MACRLAGAGSSAAVERAVSVTAPTGPVRGYFCSRPWLPRPAAHGRSADGGGRGRSLERRMRWSAACVLGEGERSVKPSAQPTLVRTKHLPPPAKTARLLRILALAGRFLLVTPCIKVCHCASIRCSVHGRIADGVRAGRAVGDTVGFPRTATDGPGRGPLSRL